MTEHPGEGSSHSSPASRHPVTARTKARRRAVEILFEADQRGMLSPEGAEELRSFAQLRAVSSANHTEAPAYTREILDGVCDHLADVDETIQTYAQGWTLGRMPAVDRAIARVATWEIVRTTEAGSSTNRTASSWKATMTSWFSSMKVAASPTVAEGT